MCRHMERLKSWIYLVLCLTMVACQRDTIPILQPTEERINLEELRVGQVNFYLRFQGERYYDTTSHEDYRYLRDTLRVAVVDQDEKGRFLFEEQYTPGSESLTGEEKPYIEEPRQYHLSIVEDSIIIQRLDPDHYHSYLIHSFSLGSFSVQSGRIAFPLAAFESPETEIKGWRLAARFFESFQPFHLPTTEIRGTNFGASNAIVDNIPMQVDGNGMTYVYNRTHGFIRTITYSAWTGNGWGWDLLVE